MSGRKSRRKGRSGEQEVARLLRAQFPSLAPSIRRGWQSREGADQPDVDGLPGVWPEVKRQKRPNPVAALEQAQRDTDGRTPVAITRADNGPWLVTVAIEDWLPMYQAWLEREHSR